MNFWDNSKCKSEQGKAILEFRLSKIVYKDTCIKVHGLWGWGFVYLSFSLSILRCTILANVFSGDLKTHKSFPLTAPSEVVKLRVSPKVTIFPPPVRYYFISDQCLKGDCGTTLFLRNSIVAQWICKVFEPIKLKRRNLRKDKPSGQLSFTFTYIEIY